MAGKGSPDLFGAIVCGSPLLDMKRSSHLLAGASGIGEYGDPDMPEEWAFIQKPPLGCRWICWAIA
jgi:prolyl oligopeptidase